MNEVSFSSRTPRAGRQRRNEWWDRERVGCSYGCIELSPHLSPSHGSRLSELSRMLVSDGSDVRVAEETEREGKRRSTSVDERKSRSDLSTSGLTCI